MCGTADRCPGKASEPEFLYRNVARLLACGLDVIGHVVDALGTLTRRQPELDETQPCAQGHEARIVAQLRHARVKEQPRAVTVRAHEVVRGSAWPEARGFGRAVRFADQAQVRRVHETRDV